MFDPRQKVLLGSESREAHWCGLGIDKRVGWTKIFRSHPGDLMVWFMLKKSGKVRAANSLYWQVLVTPEFFLYMTKNATFTDLLVKFARPFFFFSNCRTEIREVRARRDLRGPLVLPPHLTDKETEARRQAHPASVTEGQDSTRFAFAVFAYTGFPGTRNCSWRTLKITSVYSKPCHAVQWREISKKQFKPMFLVFCLSVRILQNGRVHPSSLRWINPQTG